MLSELNPEGTDRTGNLPNILNGCDITQEKSAHFCSLLLIKIFSLTISISALIEGKEFVGHINKS
jgi:hypothetical protein